MAAVITQPPVPGTGAVRRSIATLKSLHSHTVLLRELYERVLLLHSDPGLLEPRVLFERHRFEQAAIAELLLGRVRTLGGSKRPLARGIVDGNRTDSVPWARETTNGALRRILEAHGLVLSNTEPMVRQTVLDGSEIDEWIVTEFVRTNERQGWLVAEHLVMR